MKYGTPIDNDALKAAGLPGETVAELSKTAYSRMGDTSKGESPDELCIKRVNGMKEEYGPGRSTSITIYNALGLPLSFRQLHNEQGKIWKYAIDDNIYNGEWACMLHVMPNLQAIGSHGAILYDVASSEAEFGVHVVLAIGWDNPYHPSPNKAWCWFGSKFVASAGGALAWKLAETSGNNDGHKEGIEGAAALPAGKPVPRVRWTMGDGGSPILRVIVGLKSSFV